MTSSSHYSKQCKLYITQLDSFNIKKTSVISHAIKERIEELLQINKEIQNRDIIRDEYSKRIELKKEELQKRREEIESKEKEYGVRYQQLMESSDLFNPVNDKNELENLTSMEFPENEEIPKHLMSNINLMRDQINAKIGEVKDKELLIDLREKNFNEVYEKLSKEEKETFKKAEEEFLRSNREVADIGGNTMCNDIQSLNFDNFILEMRQSLNSLTKSKGSNSMGNLFDNKAKVLQPVENKMLSNSQNDFNKRESRRDSKKYENFTVKEINEIDDFHENHSNYNQSDTNNNISNHLGPQMKELMPAIEDISQIHELDMMNNKDQLLTEGVSLPLNNLSLSHIRDENGLRNLKGGKRNKNSKSGHSSLNDLKSGRINRGFNVDHNQNSRSLSNSKKHFHQSSPDFMNSGGILDGLRTNRAFYLIRQKRMEQLLNSSIEVYMDDIGGKHACGKLKKNYAMNISLTSNKINHERSSSLPGESMWRNKTKGNIPGEVIDEEDDYEIRIGNLGQIEQIKTKNYDLPLKKVDVNVNKSSLTVIDSARNTQMSGNIKSHRKKEEEERQSKASNRPNNKYAHIQPRYNLNPTPNKKEPEKEKRHNRVGSLTNVPSSLNNSNIKTAQVNKSSSVKKINNSSQSTKNTTGIRSNRVNKGGSSSNGNNTSNLKKK